MNVLTYNPRSGHVKQDGAVIGAIYSNHGIHEYWPYRFGAVPFHSEDLKELLRKVREYEDGK